MNTELEVSKLNKVITQAKRTLSTSTDGTLCISPVRSTIQFYSVHKGTRHYISKKNSQELTKLAQKRYATEVLKIAEKNKKLLSDFINKYDEQACEKLYNNLIPELKQYTQSYTLSDDEYAEQWASAEYKTKGIKEGEISYTTDNGEKVRSKSELTIANKLKSKNIKYRYEQPLFLKGYGTVYPDFTIFNKHTRQEIYLEHFGLMSNQDYVETCLKKLNTYARNNIALGKNLLITYESATSPLDTQVLDNILNAVII